MSARYLSQNTLAARKIPNAGGSPLRAFLSFDSGQEGASLIDPTGRQWTKGSAVTLTGEGGRDGYCASCAGGVNGFLTTPMQEGLQSGQQDYTQEFWFKTTQATQYATLLNIEWGNPPTTVGTTLFLNGTTGAIELWLAPFSTSAPFITTSSGVVQRNGAWHHVAVVRQSDTFTVYLDGAIIGAKTANLNIAGVLAQRRLVLGNDLTFGNGARGFVGLIDDFRYYVGLAKYTGPFTPE